MGRRELYTHVYVMGSGDVHSRSPCSYLVVNIVISIKMALHRAVRKGLLQQESSLFPLVSSSAVESLGLGSASAASHTQSRYVFNS